MIKIGELVKDFELTDHLGEKNNLYSYLDKKLVIFFYPKANTPGCTAQACNLNDNYKILLNKGFNIIGVSADEVKNQKKFVDKYSFSFPLIADSKKELINYFGVWGPKKFMGKEYDGIHRISFLVEQDGTVSHVFDKFKTKEHHQVVLDHLEQN